MSPSQRTSFGVAVLTAVFCLAAPGAGAQALQTGRAAGARLRPGGQTQTTHPTGAGMTMQPAAGQAKTSVGVSAEAAASPRSTPARSMLDEPAAAAKISVSGDRLSIDATNASLSEVIRQVAAKTGMQVEGNSRDERVFGSYGPGSAPDVLSALLYDSGYNVIMVGSTVDGAPRRLVLSTRAAGGSTQTAAAAPARSDEDDEESPAAEVPAPQPASSLLPAPGIAPTPGQPKTPQQMLEELQRMHQGQAPPDLPHDQTPQ